MEICNENNKHLIFVSTNMNLGGTEKSLISLLNALENKNVLVTLLLLEKGGELFSQIPKWVNIKFIDKSKSLRSKYDLGLYFDYIKNDLFKLNFNALINYFKTFINYIILRFKVKFEGVIQYECDTAIAYFGPNDYISYYVYKHIKAKKKIQWIHSDVTKVIYEKKFSNKYYSKFDKIFCVSENAKKIFNDMFPQYLNKTELFRNIILSDEIKKMAVKGKSFDDDFSGIKILTIGRLDKEKGQQMIPVVVNDLKKHNIKFKWYLIGDGPFSEDLKKMIEEFRVSQELILLGSKLNPYGYLKDCDIYVQTSLHEGYCLTVHEAKIFNKPIITTNFASSSNLILNNINGIIVDINSHAIYEGLLSLIEDSELRLKFQNSLSFDKQSNQTDIQKLL